MNRFENRIAVITGAANGIGKACAMRFAEEGANVACLDIDDANNQAVATAVRAKGRQALSIHCDVTHAEEIHAAIAQVLQAWGRIHIVVACAGIYSGSPLAEVPENQWQKTIDTNLTGVFLTNQAVASHFIEFGGGSIVNISSMAGKTSWPASAEYSASKSGVIGLTRSVAMELAPHCTTVNAICPGNTMTNMVRQVAARVGAMDGLTAEEWLEKRAHDCPLQRIAEPWEIAGVVAFLASDDARFITGQAIEVDGGLIMS